MDQQAGSHLSKNPLLALVAEAIPPGITVYLVGGAVRDLLLGRATHDLDFVLEGDVLTIARRLADRLGAAYYPLDEERFTARLILSGPDGDRQVLDFARMQGKSLDSDLKARDFTINAMALDLREPNRLIDPLGGLADMRSKKLRACSPTSFTDDPLRVLRAIRQASALELSIVPETRALMRKAVSMLPKVSPERLRDELFRILSGNNPSSCLRALELLGALPYVLPELTALKGVQQSAPHIHDVSSHTLETTQKLVDLLEALGPRYDPDHAASLYLGLAVMRLGRFRDQITLHLNHFFNPDRSTRPLLILAALYHDIAKPFTRKMGEDGRIRFVGHDQKGAVIAEQRARMLRLSNEEIERLKLIVYNHLRPMLLAGSGGTPSRRAIYRFFRDTGPAGVDVCLLSLADMLATYGPTLPALEWANLLDVVRSLLDAWWEQHDQVILPPPLVTGNDLIRQLKLKPGPLIGKLLEAIREAQATGQISTPDEAFTLAKDRLSSNDNETQDG